jgi:hypothetical protein
MATHVYVQMLTSSATLVWTQTAVSPQMLTLGQYWTVKLPTCNMILTEKNLLRTKSVSEWCAIYPSFHFNQAF